MSVNPTGGRMQLAGTSTGLCQCNNRISRMKNPGGDEGGTGIKPAAGVDDAGIGTSGL